jgi:hypothetical protein
MRKTTRVFAERNQLPRAESLRSEAELSTPALRRLENATMLEFIKHVLGGQNQFASGGLLLMILGSIGVFLRALPQ